MASTSRRARRAWARGEKAFDRMCKAGYRPCSKGRNGELIRAGFSSPLSIIDPFTGFVIKNVGNTQMR